MKGRMLPPDPRLATEGWLGMVYNRGDGDMAGIGRKWVPA